MVYVGDDGIAYPCQYWDDYQRGYSRSTKQIAEAQPAEPLRVTPRQAFPQIGSGCIWRAFV